MPWRSNEQKTRWRRGTGSSGARGRASGKGTNYTPDEDRQVLTSELTDRELAERIGRSVTAIQVRRWRLTNGHVTNVLGVE